MFFEGSLKGCDACSILSTFKLVVDDTAVAIRQVPRQASIAGEFAAVVDYDWALNLGTKPSF
jgi:hypothetical protein